MTYRRMPLLGPMRLMSSRSQNKTNFVPPTAAARWSWASSYPTLGEERLAHSRSGRRPRGAETRPSRLAIGRHPLELLVRQSSSSQLARILSAS